MISMDGVLNVWDFFHRQNEVAYSHKIGNAALSSIGVQGNTQSGGKLVAVGDANGSVSLLEVCDSLAIPQHGEKAAINSMFERESRREKNLEVREREIRKAKSQAEERAKREEQEKDAKKDGKMEQILQKIDEEFMAMMKSEINEDEDKTDTMG